MGNPTPTVLVENNDPGRPSNEVLEASTAKCALIQPGPQENHLGWHSSVEARWTSMEFSRQGRDVFVRLDPGDELHESLRSLSQHGITAAAITSGIGRVLETEIGYLDGDGVYQTVVHKEAMELLSVEGNLAPGPDGPFTHIHIVLSDDGHAVRGGHLIGTTVAVTAEIHLRDLSGGGAPFERVVTDSQFLRLSFCQIG